MPSNLLAVDTGFPQLTEEQSAEEKFSVITNYLYMLMEQLRYSMANLGAGNFNDAELDAIGKTITAPIYIDLENAAGAIHELRITADQLTSRMEDAEGNISSIEQYARSITLEVSNGETSSSIKLLADGVAVSSQVIVMDGLVAFKGLEDGTTIINGGCIQTGTIDAEYLNLRGAITFPDLSGEVKDDISNALDTASDAYDLAHANQLPPYIQKTYIDSTEIRSPTIKANEFSVYPQAAGGGSFNIYGQYNGSLYHMLEISYFAGSAPSIDFSSPARAVATWDFLSTTVRGSVDFSNANVYGLDVEAVFA
ncbi:gp58-like family protein [Flavonifractor plautii]|uniref:gp58-like family protein n=1 Tax=Flavonifractor plautii TaxID=292800 RepID=UPI001D009058|nr:gp58-like family protein [Flavonifractor plautii]MCB5856691.1 gp58-like family protein [Flavonifractor plautii]